MRPLLPRSSQSNSLQPKLAQTARQAAPFATTHGCLVVKAAALIESGEQSLAMWEPLVLEAVQQRYSNLRTARKVVADAKRLFRYLHACGVRRWDEVTAELVVDWCWAARRSDRTEGVHRGVAQTTARDRQWIAKAVLKEAKARGAQLDPHELIGVRIKRTSESAATRPLTDHEAELVRTHADAGPCHLAPVADGRARVRGRLPTRKLRQCGCAMSTLKQPPSYSPARPPASAPSMGGESTRCSASCATTRISSADELLCSTQSADPAHTVAVRLGYVLDDAGLKGVPGVSARSIRAHHRPQDPRQRRDRSSRSIPRITFAR